MRRCQAVQLEKENYHYGDLDEYDLDKDDLDEGDLDEDDLDEDDLDEDGFDDVFVCVERSLKFTHTAHMCGGL